MKKNFKYLGFAIVWLFAIIFVIQTASISAQTSSREVPVSTYVTVVKGAPYSAESTTESVRTFADGNKTRRIDKRLIFRDDAGRTRDEQDLSVSGYSASFIAELESIRINDPVTGFSYFLNPIKKTARKVPIISRPVITAPRTSPTGYSSKSEDLGKKIIEGFETQGRKSTTIIAPQTIGNEKEIVTTTETWFSPQLKINLFLERKDPSSGDFTTKLSNIKKEEPDKSLFTVPSDYQILVTKEDSSKP